MSEPTADNVSRWGRTRAFECVHDIGDEELRERVRNRVARVLDSMRRELGVDLPRHDVSDLVPMGRAVDVARGEVAAWFRSHPPEVIDAIRDGLLQMGDAFAVCDTIAKIIRKPHPVPGMKVVTSEAMPPDGFALVSGTCAAYSFVLPEAEPPPPPRRSAIDTAAEAILERALADTRASRSGGPAMTVSSKGEGAFDPRHGVHVKGATAAQMDVTAGTNSLIVKRNDDLGRALKWYADGNVDGGTRARVVLDAPPGVWIAEYSGAPWPPADAAPPYPGSEAFDAEVKAAGLPADQPVTEDFLVGVAHERRFQRSHWGQDHDTRKTAADWFWLVGHLAGKALHAAAAGDRAKALHHTISTGAVLSHWHEAIRMGEPRSTLNDIAVAPPAVANLVPLYDKIKHTLGDSEDPDNIWDVCPVHGRWRVGARMGGLMKSCCPSCSPLSVDYSSQEPPR